MPAFKCHGIRVSDTDHILFFLSSWKSHLSTNYSFVLLFNTSPSVLKYFHYQRKPKQMVRGCKIHCQCQPIIYLIYTKLAGFHLFPMLHHSTLPLPFQDHWNPANYTCLKTHPLILITRIQIARAINKLPNFFSR